MFFVGLARAFGGAIFFSLPLLMTMEMWWLGFYMDPLRLALFMLLMIPMLVVLDRYSGFQPTESSLDDAVDAMVAYGVGFVSSVGVLSLLNVIDTSMPAGEIVGKVSLQAIAGSFGAVLAHSQLSGGEEDGEGEEERERRRRAGYWGQVFFMAVGSVFLAFNLAPTEEMIVIAFMMTPWHGIAVVVVTLLMMHGFVYAVSFKGTPEVEEGVPGWSLFLRYSVVGYAVALLISAYVLWTFGRFDDTALAVCILETIVLGFPAGLGAAAARLIL